MSSFLLAAKARASDLMQDGPADLSYEELAE